MTCSECAHSLAEHSRYCSQCGQPVTLSPVLAASAVGDEEHTASAVSGDNALERAVSRLLPVMTAEELEAACSEGMPTPHSATGVPSASTSLVLMAAQAPAPPASLSDLEIHSLLAQANLCRLRGQWTEAVDGCVAVLRAQPGNQAAHSLLGDIYRAQNKVDDAIQWYRMAYDLKHNPADEAKLRAMEAERDRYAALSGLPRRSGGNLPPALSASGTLTGGTTALMGVSPRSWLRGLTAASLAFVGLMGIALVATHSSKKPVAHAAPAAGFGASNNAFANQNAFASHNPAAPPLGGASASGEVTGGLGMPGDRVSSSNPVSAYFPPPTRTANALPAFGPRSNAAPTYAPMAPTPMIPPASITQVRPLPAVGAAQGLGLNGVVNRREENTSPALSDGTRIVRVTRSSAGSTVAIVAVVPISTADPNDASMRGLLLRSAYRAARVILANDAALTHANITLSSSKSGAAPLLIADLDRTAALGSNPDLDNPDELQQRLSDLHWPDATPAVAPPAPAQNTFGQASQID